MEDCLARESHGGIYSVSDFRFHKALFYHTALQNIKTLSYFCYSYGFERTYSVTEKKTKGRISH